MHELVDTELPPLYQSSDHASTAAQSRFLTATRIRLVLILLAAVLGGVTWIVTPLGMDIAGALAASAFLAAMVSEIYLLKIKPEKAWYEGRAAAESVKTLSWRYAVGGAPLTSSIPKKEADALFLTGLNEILQTLAQATSIEPPTSSGHQITDQMRHVRHLELVDRRSIYERNRIREQQEWYANRSQWNQDRATFWGWSLLVLEAVAMGGAVLKAAGTMPINIFGPASAAIAGATAWLHMKQHQNLASAYSIAAHELGLIASKIEDQLDEVSWARFVEEAEEAISREHTLWKAARGIRSA